jgi:hypothetical protein
MAYCVKTLNDFQEMMFPESGDLKTTERFQDNVRWNLAGLRRPEHAEDSRFPSVRNTAGKSVL